MTPDYIRELANMVDPNELWRTPVLDQRDLPVGQRMCLDAGVALRRYAGHLEDLEQVMYTGRSLLITPLSSNGTAVTSANTPAKHRRLKR